MTKILQLEILSGRKYSTIAKIRRLYREPSQLTTNSVCLRCDIESMAKLFTIKSLFDKGELLTCRIGRERFTATIVEYRLLKQFYRKTRLDIVLIIS